MLSFHGQNTAAIHFFIVQVKLYIKSVMFYDGTVCYSSLHVNKTWRARMKEGEGEREREKFNKKTALLYVMWFLSNE